MENTKSITTDKMISEQIYQIVESLEMNGRYVQTKLYYHHGKTTVYEHSINVAYLSCKIARKFNAYVNYESLIRGALLHDYYLYDWHIPSKEHRLHGFSHPAIAFENANQDYGLNEIEENIILCHMFPLTIIPPITIKGWIVSFADKINAVMEMKRGKYLKGESGCE